MTDTAAETHVNGAQPAQPEAEAPCENCVTSGERLLAVVAFLLGAFVIATSIDMFTGGWLSGKLPVRAAGGE